MYGTPLMSLENQKEIKAHTEQFTVLSGQIRSPVSGAGPVMINMENLDILVNSRLPKCLELSDKYE